MLTCCKLLFEYIGANLAHIQAENLQNNVKIKNAFMAKSSRSQLVKQAFFHVVSIFLYYCRSWILLLWLQLCWVSLHGKMESKVLSVKNSKQCISVPF